MKIQDRIDGYVTQTLPKKRTSWCRWGDKAYKVTPAQRRRIMKKQGHLLNQANKLGFK